MKTNIKRKIAFIVAATMLLTFTSVWANDEVEKSVPLYGSYTGMVKDIVERENGSLFIILESEASGSANFIITKNTYKVDNLEIKIGQSLIGFYETNRPMILIYPPQYNISVVAELKNNLFVEADRFDSNLVNADNTLKLNIFEDTEILWKNGTEPNWIKAPIAEELTAALGDRRLVVFYDVTTRSIPAQCTPKKIIVLSKKEAKPVSDVSVFDIEVDNTVITSPHAFKAENGTVMMPVRAISEALGMKVGWKNETQTVTVGEELSFSIGNKAYQAYGSKVEMDIAPVLKNSVTYVPIEFFKVVLPLWVAEVYEGRIVITPYH